MSIVNPVPELAVSRMRTPRACSVKHRAAHRRHSRVEHNKPVCQSYINIAKDSKSTCQLLECDQLNSLIQSSQASPSTTLNTSDKRPVTCQKEKKEKKKKKKHAVEHQTRYPYCPPNPTSCFPIVPVTISQIVPGSLTKSIEPEVSLHIRHPTSAKRILQPIFSVIRLEWGTVQARRAEHEVRVGRAGERPSVVQRRSRAVGLISVFVCHPATETPVVSEFESWMPAVV